jgi:MarR family transcriptional regulator, transcriptional regulator for hemolysin
MRKAFDQRVSEIGVTGSRWTMLAVVASQPGSTQRKIAEFLEMSEASAGRLLDRLCEEGLIERRAKEDDRRAHCVYATDKAKPILEALGRFGVEHEQAAFAGFSEAELATLNDLLARIYNNISNLK